MLDRVLAMSIQFLQEATLIEKAFCQLVEASARQEPMPIPVMPMLQQQHAARLALRRDHRSNRWCNIPRGLSPGHAKMIGALAVALASLGQLLPTLSLVQAMRCVLQKGHPALDRTAYDKSLEMVYTAHIKKVGLSAAVSMCPMRLCYNCVYACVAKLTLW